MSSKSAYIKGRGKNRVLVVNTGKKKTLNQKVKRIITRNIEKKHYDKTLAGGVVVNVPIFYDTSTVPQGGVAAYDTVRDGDVIFPKYLEIRYSFTREVTSTTRDNVRMVVFQWKSDMAVDTPTHGKLMASTGTNPIMSGIQWDLKGRFNILSDRTIPIDTLANDRTPKNGSLIIKGSRLLKKMEYNPAAVTGRNHVYIMFLGENAAGNDDTLVNVFSRLVFSD